MAKTYTQTTWVDEVLSGAIRYDILEDGGTPISETVQINLATSVAQAGTPVDADLMNNLEDGVDLLDDILAATGWIPDSDTWTYASATTFTIAGDVTSVFRKGTKLKLTQTTAKYFYVVSSSYSSPNTTVTITGGTDYTLPNAAITSPYYSHIENPAAFPHWFNWLPTYTGSASLTFGTVTTLARFSISGLTVRFYIDADGTTGGTASNQLRFTTPVSMANSTGIFPLGETYTADGGAVVNGRSFAQAANRIGVLKEDASNFGLGAGRKILVQGQFEML